MKARAQFRLRLYRDAEIAIGPGKIALLEAIVQERSITAAAVSLGMSYRRAWLLLDALNRSLVQPAVATTTGGAKGGGTVVTETGLMLIRRYRAIEETAAAAAADDIAGLAALLVK